MPKNTDGSIGPICNNCGGFGFTNLATGGSAGCSHCLGSGIDERRMVADRLTRIEARLDDMAASLVRLTQKVQP